jgi:transcription elongation factor/antiterminator RfaH
MIPPAAQWYALYLRSRYEKKVYKELEKKNVKAFLPLVEEVHVWSDRKKKVMEPLFRGYVFVKTDLRDKEIILITKGVVRFVGINGKPSRIPESQIDWLRRIIGESIKVQREQYLRVGERVRIISGPLLGVEGIVSRTHGISRVVVSIAAIEQSVSVQVPAELLEILRMSKG